VCPHASALFILSLCFSDISVDQDGWEIPPVTVAGEQNSGLRCPTTGSVKLVTSSKKDMIPPSKLLTRGSVKLQGLWCVLMPSLFVLMSLHFPAIPSPSSYGFKMNSSVGCPTGPSSGKENSGVSCSMGSAKLVTSSRADMTPLSELVTQGSVKLQGF